MSGNFDLVVLCKDCLEEVIIDFFVVGPVLFGLMLLIANPSFVNFLSQSLVKTMILFLKLLD